MTLEEDAWAHVEHVNRLRVGRAEFAPDYKSAPRGFNGKPRTAHATRPDNVQAGNWDGKHHVPTAHEVETFSGNFVDTLNPRPETILLEDVAHALAATSRFGGHTRAFYSVAEHAVFCANYVFNLTIDREAARAALHHDDAEAYLGDIPRPLKSLLKDYKELEARMSAAICLALDVPGNAPPFDAVVHEADEFALFVEARHLLKSKGANWAGHAEEWGLDMTLFEAAKDTPNYWKGGLTPTQAKDLYLSTHWRFA